MLLPRRFAERAPGHTATRPILVLLGATLFLAVASVRAEAGLPTAHLTWDDCQGTGTSNKSDACAPGMVGPHYLTLSLSPTEPLTMVNGAQGSIEVYFDADDIPDFWSFQTGGCANGSLTADYFVDPEAPPSTCPNPWDLSGGQLGALNWTLPYDLCNNRARLVWIVAVPNPGLTIDPAVAPVWSLFRFRFNGDSDTCAGCPAPACLWIRQVRITRPASAPGSDYFFEYVDDSGYATWQGHPQLACSMWKWDIPCPVPVVKPTWGQIKSLYR